MYRTFTVHPPPAACGRSLYVPSPNANPPAQDGPRAFTHDGVERAPRSLQAVRHRTELGFQLQARGLGLHAQQRREVGVGVALLDHRLHEVANVRDEWDARAEFL